MNIFQGCMPAQMTPCDARGVPHVEALVATGQDLMAAAMSAVIDNNPYHGFEMKADLFFDLRR